MKHVVADLRKEVEQLSRERMELWRVISELQTERLALVAALRGLIAPDGTGVYCTMDVIKAGVDALKLAGAWELATKAVAADPDAGTTTE